MYCTLYIMIKHMLYIYLYPGSLADQTSRGWSAWMIHRSQGFPMLNHHGGKLFGQLGLPQGSVLYFICRVTEKTCHSYKENGSCNVRRVFSKSPRIFVCMGKKWRLFPGKHQKKQKHGHLITLCISSFLVLFSFWMP